jgi:folate-binding protein YgfZ
VVTVGGPDRIPFLQGLVSNDVTRATANAAVWAALLTPQGRFLNEMFVVDGGNDVLMLETERDRASALAKKLSLYKLRSKVTIDDRSPAVEVGAVFGTSSAAAPTLPGVVAFADPRLGELGYRLIAPNGTLRQTLTAHGMAEAPFEQYEARRLALGVPDGSRDLPVEKALLLENGFDELHGIDWNKGCYMGQELTARTKYRALIRKRLLPVNFEGDAPIPGTAVHMGGKEVGEVRSGSGPRALALLQIDAVNSGAVLSAGGRRVVPEIPSWLQLSQASAGKP